MSLIDEIPVLNADELEDRVRAALEDDNVELLRDLLQNQYAADIADVLERLPDGDDRYRIFDLLDQEHASEVLDEAGYHTTYQLLAKTPPDKIIGFLDRMPVDDVVELLAEDVPDDAEELLSRMTTERAAEIREALNYPPESAGRLMTRRYLRINEDMTAEGALHHMRRVNPRVETIDEMYVVNKQGYLIGVVSLRDVLNTRPNHRIGDFMETQLVTVTPETDQEEAARILARYDFTALPVVTTHNRMLGIITVDDAIDVLTAETTEDILRFGAVSGEDTDQPYFTVPIFRVVRQRFGWLLLLFLADTLTGNVLRIFEDELAAVVALSFYIPLLIGTGGNTGAQTVSTIIRGLAVRDIRLRDTFRVIRREMLSGLILGTSLGVVAALRAYWWDNQLDYALQLAVVVGVTVVVVCAWANTIGSLIPLAARRIGIDPAVVSAPMITTLVDASGLFIYLTIARILLSGYLS